MSHRPAWLCVDCGYQLGEIVCGAVRIWAPTPLVGPDATSVVCPRCGRVNVWQHRLETAAR